MAPRESGRALTESRRELIVSTALALWGFAVAIALIGFWDRPAPPGQLPGLATTLNFDAHGPFRWVAGLVLLPILFPLLLRPVSRMVARGETWAFAIASIAPVFTLWCTTWRRSIPWSIIPCAIVLAVCALLRNRELRFTRHDTVLVPVFLATVLAMIDVAPSFHTDMYVYVAALIVLATRIAVAFIPSPLPPALAFVAAPLGLVLQTGFFARDQRYFGWHALALVVVTPFILRPLLKNGRRAAAILAFAIYPIALYAYSNAMSLETAEGKSRLNFFEDGHSLLPASEYLRGERPYRDILPAHGLLEDGLFDYVAMKSGGVTLGARAKARLVASNFTAVALYAVAFAATGSAEAAFFSVLFSFLTVMLRGQIRLIPPLIALAFVVSAVRRRRPKRFAYAAAFTVLAGVTSLDFAFYSFVALVVALIRYRYDRAKAFRYAAIGTAVALVPLVVLLAAFGILGDFVRGTFVETLAVGPAYTMNFFTPPPAMARLATFPEVLVALFEREVFQYLFWCFAVVFTAVMITRRASRRLEPIVLLGVWIAATGISYAERHHVYFGLIAAVMTVWLALRLARSRSALAIPVIVATIAMAAPTMHFIIAKWVRQSRGPLEKGWVEMREIPRARGVWIRENDAHYITGVQKYLSLALAPDETFFDFTNSGALYFLFRKDSPIREYEVAFYETEAQQREVIRRIETNPKVRAALVPVSPGGRFAVDIPNEVRAPLVWHYLKTHFHPDFQEGEVVFWRRN